MLKIFSYTYHMITIMHDDVHVAEDGHRCCVMTIMLDDVHVAEDG